MKNYIQIILRGFGQVMLQNNALTGLLFLAGIFYNSWLMGLGAIAGNVISTSFAGLLKYSKDDIKDGLYGFNGTLVGIAIYFFFGFGIFSTVFLFFGAALSAIIMREMKKWLPALTMPFVISTWAAVVFAQFFNITQVINGALLQTDSFHAVSAVATGVSQVMLQENAITGLLFFLGILVNSRTAAFYAVYGSLLGALSAILFSFPLAAVNSGIFGYNAALCGIALGGKKYSAFILASFAVILSVLLNFAMGKIGIVALTAPFVFATWIALFIKYFVNYKLHETGNGIRNI